MEVARLILSKVMIPPNKQVGRPAGSKNGPSAKKTGPKPKRPDPNQQTILQFVRNDNASTDLPAHEDHRDIADPSPIVSGLPEDFLDDFQEFATLAELQQQPEARDDDEFSILDDVDVEKELVDDETIPESDTHDTEEVGSVLEDYFANIQSRCQRQGEHLEEYTKKGTFWVHPRREPFFSLREEIDPEPLYLPRVFLWFSHLLLPGGAKDLKCSECKLPLKCKGYTKTPYARRVIDLDG